MSAGFTPGPWLLEGNTVYALDESGSCNRFSVWPQGGFVFRADPYSNGEHTSDAELEANANLIAAAPELYEALEHILSGSLSLPRFAEEQARAALSKARGSTDALGGER